MKNEKIKIIHVVESFSGGTFDFIKDLIDGLQEFDHLVVCGIREDTPADYEKIIKAKKFFVVKNFQREINIKKDLKAFFEIVRILKRQRNNNVVIHLHSSKAGFLGRIASALTGWGKNVIYTSHGASFLRKDISSFKRFVYVILEKIATFFGGIVIACSESEANEFKRFGINAIYIYNGVKDYSLILKNAYLGNKRQKIIGCSGRITEAKNPKLFNQIAMEFLERKDIKFIWIGDGPLRQELNSPNIEITGWLNQNEAIEFMHKFVDIYLSTSLWEGLPLTVLQAMSLKKPLVLSRCIGNVDLVVNGINGFIFSTMDEAIEYLSKLIENSTLRFTCGENSYKLYCEKFTIKNMVNQYRNLYYTLLDKSTRKRGHIRDAE